jgi:hypothetical protein
MENSTVVKNQAGGAGRRDRFRRADHDHRCDDRLQGIRDPDAQPYVRAQRRLFPPFCGQACPCTTRGRSNRRNPRTLGGCGGSGRPAVPGPPAFRVRRTRWRLVLAKPTRRHLRRSSPSRSTAVHPFRGTRASEQLFSARGLREDANYCERRGGSDADAHPIWLQLGGCHATAREPPKERASPRQPHRRRNGATASARRS